MEQVIVFRIAIIVLFLAVFAEASLAKIIGREVPSWFRDQFATTWMGRLPIGAMWWTIAVLELVVAGLFVAGAATGEWAANTTPLFLGYGTLGAMFVFAMLCFGQRVSFDFAGAASSFFYATLSGVTWYILWATV